MTSSQGITSEADGGQVKAGIITRLLAWLGSDITLTGSGANTYTFPTNADTLAGLGSTQSWTGSNTVGSGGSLATSGTGTIAATSVVGETFPGSGLIVGTTDTQAMTQKRITRRLVAVTQSATPAINSNNMDIANITGLAQAITSMTSSLTGTPVDGDLLEIRITDNGTGYAITWGASFGSTTISLPTTTVASTMLRTLFEWNATASLWQCIAVA